MRKASYVLLAAVLLFSLVVVGCDKNNSSTNNSSSAIGTTNPKGTVQGFVRDHATNVPIANATVRLYATGERVTTTNARGYWYFADVQADDGDMGNTVFYSITAPTASPDYLEMMGQVDLNEQVGYSNGTNVGQTNSLITVNDYMVKTATITGFVTDGATGKGINGASVILNLSTGSQLRPSGSNAFIMVAPQYLATTTTSTASGAAGAYQMSVPALYLNSGYFGAYASGYEYGTMADVSDLNLQYASSAVADYRLTPVDTNLGLVVAQVTVASTGKDLLILRDASGSAPGGATPNIDLSGATQMMFSLIFDQAVNTAQFFNDSIILRDSAGNTVLPSMTAVWSNAYSVTLTGDFDLKKFTSGTTYQLRTNRAIYAKTENTTIATATNLVQFRASNSSLAPTNPTPAVYLTPGTYDTSIMAHNGVLRYLASDPAYLNLNNMVTTASNYTGIGERFTKTKFTFDSNAYTTALDLVVPRTQANVDASSITLYFRIVNQGSGEVLRNWSTLNSTGTVAVNDDNIVYTNIQPIATNLFPYDVAGNTDANLRYGNRLDFAATVKDTLGVESAIDEAKALQLRDARNPELANTSLASRQYNNADIDFSEQMNTTAGVSVTNLTNSGLFTSAPIWDVAGTTAYLNASGAATASIYETGAVGVDTISGAVITFNAAGDADKFFQNQVLRIRYADSTEATLTVSAIDTAGNAPTITLSGSPDTMRYSTTVPFTIFVDKTTTLRPPVRWTGLNLVNGNTTFTAGAGMQLTVGDKIVLRSSTAANPPGMTDTSVTVVDYASAGGTLLTTAVAGDASTTYDIAIFEGDVLQITASDEAGNSLHGDANEMLKDVNNVYGAGANAVLIR